MAYIIKSLIFAGLFLFFGDNHVFASETPSLINPSNNSIITSIPTFSWQAIPGSSGYNILIDEEPTVTSPYAKSPYYPTNPSYSPKSLNPGTYYWKVKAKNSNGDWGSFSTIWSFTLISSSPAPTPSSSPSSNPAPSTSTTTTSFIASDIPSQINSDQSFKVSVFLSLPTSPNSIFYLKGAFKKSDSSNYFGITKVGSSWVKNSSTFSEQYKITTNSSGNWSGSLEVQADTEDSGFSGTGDYIFKVARYSSSGSGPTWSNEATIKIISTESNSQGTAITESTSTSIDSLTTDQQSSSPVIRKSASIVRINIPKQLAYQIASIAAASSESAAAITTPQPTIKQEKRINFSIIVGTFLLLSGFSSLFYIYLQRKKGI